MTRDDFKKQSDELFFEIKKNLFQQIMESSKTIFSNAAECPDKMSALHQVSNELSTLTSNLSFEASCDYSEKLALLLFDQFSQEE